MEKVLLAKCHKKLLEKIEVIRNINDDITEKNGMICLLEHQVTYLIKVLESSIKKNYCTNDEEDGMYETYRATTKYASCKSKIDVVNAKYADIISDIYDDCEKNINK